MLYLGAIEDDGAGIRACSPHILGPARPMSAKLAPRRLQFNVGDLQVIDSGLSALEGYNAVIVNPDALRTLLAHGHRDVEPLIGPHCLEITQIDHRDVRGNLDGARRVLETARKMYNSHPE